MALTCFSFSGKATEIQSKRPQAEKKVAAKAASKDFLLYLASLSEVEGEYIGPMDMDNHHDKGVSRVEKDVNLILKIEKRKMDSKAIKPVKEEEIK